MSNSAFTELLAHQKTTTALGQVNGLIGWDQETLMAKGSAAQRSEQMAAMEEVLHDRRTDPRIAGWLEEIETANLDATGQAVLREARRSYDRSVKIPSELAIELARATSMAQGVWAEARNADNFADFKGTLDGVVKLRREEAACLSDGADVYDALLQDYEPGATASEIKSLFDELRSGLTDLRGRIQGSSVQIDDLSGAFDGDQQMALAAELATIFGYDWNRGRLDKSVHPFSSGSFNDVRITTRVSEDDPFNCFYSTIHEVGHAVYEQNISQDLGLTILGEGASMGVHESQSRILENQLGRSRAFCGHLFQMMTEMFGDFGIKDADAFYRRVNKMQSGFIRTEADEVQYNLHIMMRFDLEQALMSGDLSVGNLESAWNDRFEADFGYPVDRASNGVLQDVHWSVGLFGYFPTYSLGNLYAGALYERLRKDVPNLDEGLAKGQIGDAITWLTKHVHQYGSLMEPKEVMRQATGSEISPKPLLAYLNAKFSDIYSL